MDFPWQVVYEDENYYIINKPAGFAVQSVNPPSVESLLQDAGLPYFPVHRIDQPVSGLTLLAKSAKAFELCTQLFKDRRIEKTYLALVQGHPTSTKGTINTGISKIRSKAFVNASSEKVAITHYEVIATFERLSLLRISLETGRFHQIRCHLSHIGHAIRGDIKYGARKAKEEKGIYLHSYRVSLPPFQMLPHGLKVMAPCPQMPTLWKLVNNM